MSLYSQTLAGIHLLVVEDSPDNRDLLVFVLKNEGALVTAVGLAHEALLTLDRLKPDAILCDIRLPDGNGYELIREWREREKRLGLFPIPAIAVTVSVSEQDRQMAYDSGFQLYVTKPYDILSIPKSIAKLIAPVVSSKKP